MAMHIVALYVLFLLSIMAILYLAYVVTNLERRIKAIENENITLKTTQKTIDKRLGDKKYLGQQVGSLLTELGDPIRSEKTTQ